MTLFAGMYSLKSSKSIDPNLVGLLKESIARTQGKIDIYSDERFALIKWDCEAFQSVGIINDVNGVSAITGEPYWESTRTDYYSRTYDLEKISEQLRHKNIKFLTTCHGNYSVCHYEKNIPRLVLAVDKLGSRSLYYIIHDNILFFASAIRILELIKIIPKKFDISAFVEKRVFGVSLANNTRYIDIKVLRDGQFIECNKQNIKISYYFQWKDIKQLKHDNLDLIKNKCYNIFNDAVKIRSSRDSNALAFLSGGMDSRCVVSILNSLGKKIIAFNFSLPGDKDELYGKEYAEQLKIDYFSENRQVNRGVYELISGKLESIDQNILKQVSYPRLIFSGDGGSVGMGHVYLSDALLERYQKQGLGEAINYFLSRRKLSNRIFKKKIRDKMRDIPKNGLKRELEELKGVAPGRDFYLFLLRNDQRRHLEQFWEIIDLAKVEFLEPFYDARLLSFITSAPINPFIGHRFYTEWLELFPPDARSVPWQTYPGHAPCPIATNDDSISQWEMHKDVRKTLEKENYHNLMKVIFKKKYPYHLVNRLLLYAAIIAYKFNIKDIGYVIDLAHDIYLENLECTSYHE